MLPTLAILLLDGFVGAALARSQGRTAWARFNRALAEGRVPARETFDGAMIIVGGALLLAPGFITDTVGFAAADAADAGAAARRRRAAWRGAGSRFAWTVLGRRGPGAARRPAASAGRRERGRAATTTRAAPARSTIRPTSCRRGGRDD